MAIQQYRRRHTQLKMTPYQTDAGMLEARQAQHWKNTASVLEPIANAGVAIASAVIGKESAQASAEADRKLKAGEYETEDEKKELEEQASGIGKYLVDKNGKMARSLGDMANISSDRSLQVDQDKYDAALIDAYEGARQAQAEIREKYRDNPDSQKMNDELRTRLDDVYNQVAPSVPTRFASKFREQTTKNLRSMMDANFNDAEQRQRALAKEKKARFNGEIERAQRNMVYEAGRAGTPIQQVFSAVVPQELIDNPNMPVPDKLRKEFEEIPMLYIDGALDRPVVNRQESDGSITPGILQDQQLHAPVNFEKVIDDYYDGLEESIDKLEMSDRERKNYKNKIEYNRESRKQELYDFLGDYKTRSAAAFMADPAQFDYEATHLFDKQSTVSADQMIEEDVLDPKIPTIKWERSDITNEMARLQDNVYKPSKTRVSLVESAPKVFKALRLPDASTPEEKEERTLLGLRNTNAIYEDPKTTNGERQTVRTTVSKALADPEYAKKLATTMIAAQVFDKYSDLQYAPFVATDPEFAIEERGTHEKLGELQRMGIKYVNGDQEFKMSPDEVMRGVEDGVKMIDARIAEGWPREDAFSEELAKLQGVYGDVETLEKIYNDVKSGDKMSAAKTMVEAYDKWLTDRGFTKEVKPSAASERNRAKYNVVRDTYVAVMKSVDDGDFEQANSLIRGMPYEIAKLNYGEWIAPGTIDQFRIIDEDGEKTVYPQFMYKGYNFEYLGMDERGVIKARRKL